VFTGIVEAKAKILSKTDAGFTIERPPFFDDVKLGSSISVSGVCLSIVEFDVTSMRFDVIDETWDKTNLRDLRVGDLVNLERAMKAGDRLDGHVVQGHVEGVGVVVGVSSIPRPLPPGEEGETRHKRLGRNILYWMRGMRKHPTEAEAFLWHALRHDALGARFRRQYSVGGRILDFYCPEHNLALEVDGGYHKRHKILIQDHERDAYLQDEYQLRTLRFTNDEVLHSLPATLQKITQAIKHTPPPSEEGLGVEENKNRNKRLTIRVPKESVSAIAPKGSIALDGVSLTVADIRGDLCTVALIPHTLANTTLKNLKEGDRVNVETDILARTHAQK
jgi:riboflavin synthase alpha subunit/very-short-patch-repair endonuclease